MSSASERAALDDIEAGGYVVTEVTFKLGGRQAAGFTHKPVTLTCSPNLKPTSAYLQLMIEGAEASRLKGLAEDLGQMRANLR